MNASIGIYLSIWLCLCGYIQCSVNLSVLGVKRFLVHI